MARLGFIGTGTITAAMVCGLKGSALAQWPVLLSPRGAAIAQDLAATLPGVMIAADNQAVIDGADLVVLAVRPQVAEAVLRPLRIGSDRLVVSLIAGLAIPTIRDWTGAARIARAVPLPFVEHRRDVVPVHPPLPEALDLFNHLGHALPVTDARDFDVFAAASALMGSYFGVLEVAQSWAEAQGLPAANARAYLGTLFANLGTRLAESPESFQALRQDHSTPGGLNEQVFARFAGAGGTQALTAGLDSVLRRLRA